MEDSSLPLSVSNDFEDCTNLENDDLDEYLEDSEGTGEESDGLGEDMEDSRSTGEEIDDLDEDMEDSKGTGEENDDLDEHMEDTKGTEEEEGLYDCALFNGKPYKELTEDDLHGVSFKTIAEVESFYSYYSLAMGFSVRRNKLDWNASGTIVTRRSLVCSRQGTRRESGKARPVVNEVEGLKRRCVGNQHKKSVVNDCQPTPKRKKQRTPQKGRLNGRTQTRRLTRGNCPAGLTVTWCSKRRAYYASQFVTEHNHSLARMEHLQFLNSHRHVKGHALAQVTSIFSDWLGRCCTPRRS